MQTFSVGSNVAFSCKSIILNRNRNVSVKYNKPYKCILLINFVRCERYLQDNIRNKGVFVYLTIYM